MTHEVKQTALQKFKEKLELKFCAQTDDDIIFCLGLEVDVPETAIWNLTSWLDPPPGTYPVNKGLPNAVQVWTLVSRIWWCVCCYFSLLFLFPFFEKKKKLFTYFWLPWVFAVFAWAFSSCSEQGLLFVVVLRLLIAMTSLVAEL